ncbi:unnamed protein product [Rotaria sp. Silwood1]|nr:unnamed protein product [Rotaria sp. Silwood1]
MSLENTVNEDDDIQSVSSSTNSDDNINEFHCHTHRTCSRYASCNRQKHQYSSIDSINSKSFLNNSNPVKGDLRYIDNDPGHRQKYDGMRWRRVCCMPQCLVYLNGGIYFDNWLCRKHYLLVIQSDICEELDNPTIQDKRQILSAKKSLQRTSARRPSKNINSYQRGDIRVDAEGIRHKYDGQSWRLVCSIDSCKSYIVAHGYCHRHDMENRKKKPKVLSALNDTPQQQNSIPQAKIKQSTIPTRTKPKKGEIRLVRQQWNGTKWYSLCHYHTRNCKRRSAGVKSAYLCEKHYKEYIMNQKNPNLIYNDNDNGSDNDQILLSPIIKRKKTHTDSILSTNIADHSNTIISSQSRVTIDRRKPVEQYIQTDVTYPIDSIDLRQGCILIEDDKNDQYQCDSPQYMVYIKKEEEDYPTNKRRLAIDINSLPYNCKLELTKLEM